MLNLLFFLFQDIAKLLGVGGRRRSLYARLMGERVIDVLWHLPTDIHQRQYLESLGSHNKDQYITIKARVSSHQPSSRSGQPYRIEVITQDNQIIELTFFHGREAYLRRIAPYGKTVLISGKLKTYQNRKDGSWQMIHPGYIGAPENLKDWMGMQSVYPRTAGLTRGMIRSVIEDVLNNLHPLPEWLEEDFLKQQGWLGWTQSLHQAHNPQKAVDLTMFSAARQRLAYDEMLAHQLSLHLSHRQKDRRPADPLKGTGDLVKLLLKNLPFQLTPCQIRAFEQISNDLQKNHQTLRLLQGDVGSGKTIVALLSALQAIESGYQASLLAPTDLLARQHYQTIVKLSQNLGIHVALLTAREKGRLRQQILQKLETRQIDLLIGTHALFQSPIQFNRLGFVIIDEQHRFGVEQRLALSAKGTNPHILSMTATPIPRTLMLTNYGDMDVSTLKEKPPGRQPITTRVMSLKRLEEVLTAVQSLLNSGQKIYWICPLVEESETLDLSAVTERYQFLSRRFPGKVAWVHGQMKSQDKERSMTEFVQGDASILVATTVIEVGIDVPAATVMVIEHAERFGLAQLHQLRGRVGRGEKTSSCLLLYGQPLTSVARQRLAIMRESQDGFVIAETDLKLRGGGEMLGTRQSGLPNFRFLNWANSDEKSQKISDLLAMANREAKQIVSQDPELESERGKALRLLLQLFNKDDTVRYRCSG